MPENALPLPSTARPGASAADADAVWAVLTGMYEAYDAGDRSRIDQALDPRATVWDSAASSRTGPCAATDARAQSSATRNADSAVPAASCSSTAASTRSGCSLMTSLPRVRPRPGP
ncbi:hypothetical protein [Streptomyces atratus]|uniref:hypothetical protein n=1 Tax=Streptomyces atratus TaxID=1893 RepID=UPI002250E391|nr:hypothetical protein [Streptomyces atratus]MCX5339690.1 hypothetical protein [Streptomyces atratus]